MSQTTAAGRTVRLHEVLSSQPTRVLETPHSLRVLLVDSNEVVRAGMRLVVGAQADIEVTAAVGSAEEALCHVASAAPDVVLISDRPGEQGPRLCRSILKQRPSATVIVLASNPPPAIVAAYVEAGAKAFFARGITEQELGAAIRAASHGVCILAPGPAETIMEWARRSISADQAANVVSGDETQVIMALADGLSNRAIAVRLDVAEHVVKARLSSAMRKLGASRRAGLVAVAIRAGIIPDGRPKTPATRTRRVTLPPERAAGDTASRRIRVVVVDDRKVVRTGISVLMDEGLDVKVVASETSASGAVTAATETDADVILIDLQGQCDVVELGRALAENRLRACLIGLCPRRDETLIRTALQAGARACLSGKLDVARLERAITTVVRRATVKGCAGLVDWGSLQDKRRAHTLSPAERRVLELLVGGFTNHEIAASAATSSHNVKRLVKQLYAKMGVNTRAEAVAVGLRERVLR